MEILPRLDGIRETQKSILEEVDALRREVDAVVDKCGDSAICRVRLAELEALISELQRPPSRPVAPPASAPPASAPPSRPLPSAPPPSLVSPPACDQTSQDYSSVQNEIYHKLLIRAGCTPRILLPASSLRFADEDHRTLSEFLDMNLSERTVASLLFQVLWTLLALQYTWTGARLQTDYLLSIPVYLYNTPRAFQLTLGGEPTTFRVESAILPVFYNMWYFITCKSQDTKIVQDSRSLDEVFDCTAILEEFASHPAKAFDIARKLLRYKSNAYALVLSDEFTFLRAPQRPTDTLLRL